ncbi:Signal transduction histidine kinase, contains PAS domain [Halorhabdus sp. SVX81]|uniref:sensor histidine kinase n=1 Tax=Halorhabdus sp. SVX81 TaxID=2978283 RepID=UPI0023DAB532|nr:ATP-binding protein [Halorhabdus sp. SVX81]WEL16296.1 Signal transduction histidine kinase, contains PAS domain [Halorhabdus sp. SVX81]
MIDGLSIGGRFWYLAVFGLSGVATFVSAVRVNRIAEGDTRRGLVALLLTSGGWALAHVAYLATADQQLGVFLYQIGLVVGLSTIGGWLYFCSAYTGRSLHRDPRIRWTAVVAFLAIVAVKLTNNLHGLYFSSEVVSTPFPHVAITSTTLHWTVMAGSYALATVGYFMLYERFRHVSHDSRPLLLLLGLTALPVGFDVLGMLVPGLMEITYEPVGVAAFAVGLSFVYFERFRTIRLAGDRDNPVIVLDDDDRIQDYNRAATRLVPALDDRSVIGEPFADIAPECAEKIATDDPLVTVYRDGETRYYRVTEQQFSASQSSLGRALVFTDETHRERYRNELERQNDRLDSFASMLSHDLRNPLNVAQGRLELARDQHDSEHLEAAAGALDRIEGLIEDVLQLARQGQPIEEADRVTLSAIARDAWGMVETAEAKLVVETDRDIEADPDRLQRLFENLFRNAVEHGGESVTVTVGPLDDGDGFFVADDGAGIPAEKREQVFESGYSTAEDGTGFGLAIVEQIVAAHEWGVELADVEDGTRFEIRT